MYGHQVVDDLKQYVNKVDDEIYQKMIKKMIRLINQAQHFHLGEWMDIKKHFGSQITDKNFLFYDKEIADIRLPYPICWFDYSCNPPKEDIGKGDVAVPKRGVLTVEISADCFECFIFNYNIFTKKWGLGLASYIISIGKSLNKCEAARFFVDQKHNVIKFNESDEGNINICLCLSEKKVREISGLNCKQFGSILMEDDALDIKALNICLMLLGCKNIGTQDHLPPVKLNKKRRLLGKQPLFTYHTLVVKPIGKRQESIPKHLWNNRVHLQRGHFKTFTEEKPLFGHITGRFWWQPHVRGKNQEGIVMKDYRIETEAMQ